MEKLFEIHCAFQTLDRHGHLHAQCPRFLLLAHSEEEAREIAESLPEFRQQKMRVASIVEEKSAGAGERAA